MRIDAADHADMAAALAAREHGDGADFRLGDAPAVIGEGARGVGIGSRIAELGQHEIHEGRAPQPFALGRIGAEIFARLGDQRRPAQRGFGGFDQTRHVGRHVIGGARPLRPGLGQHLQDRVRALRGVIGARRGIAESGKAQGQKADAADGDSKVKLQTHERVPVTQFSCWRGVASSPGATPYRCKKASTAIFRAMSRLN